MTQSILHNIISRFTPGAIVAGRLRVAATISAIALLIACAKAVPADIIAHADDAVARGDTAQALQCCQSLGESDLTPSELCQCALIYAKLAQMGNNPEHMASAAACLKQAIELDADSVINFGAGLQYGDLATLIEVFNLCDNAIDENDEASLYESVDSLFTAP